MCYVIKSIGCGQRCGYVSLLCTSALRPVCLRASCHMLPIAISIVHSFVHFYPPSYGQACRLFSYGACDTNALQRSVYRFHDKKILMASPTEFDVIVVGAGVEGSSTAYQLINNGAKRVLLLEQVRLKFAGA